MCPVDSLGGSRRFGLPLCHIESLGLDEVEHVPQLRRRVLSKQSPDDSHGFGLLGHESRMLDRGVELDSARDDRPVRVASVHAAPPVLARTIATMPARTAGASVGHAEAIKASSGSVGLADATGAIVGPVRPTGVVSVPGV